nr:hypothetical protein [Tanacetum cinerariifolium]
KVVLVVGQRWSGDGDGSGGGDGGSGDAWCRQWCGGGEQAAAAGVVTRWWVTREGE